MFGLGPSRRHDAFPFTFLGFYEFSVKNTDAIVVAEFQAGLSDIIDKARLIGMANTVLLAEICGPKLKEAAYLTGSSINF